jgi:Glycosyltransferase family 92
MMRLKAALRLPLTLRARAEDAALARRPHHELAVAAVFREEAPFLEEWLTFHRGVGVSHFYLYNNFSTDDFRVVLEPWIAAGMVTLHDWPVPVGQLPAYRHCVRHYRRQARWIAFIDIDEFLFSPRQTDIRPILAEYGDLPGIVVHSPYFGTGGHVTRPAEPVVESFLRRGPLTLASAKTIANPRWIYAIRDVHLFKYCAGEALDTARLRPGAGGSPAVDRLCLNHYWSRSMNDLQTKVRRGDASTHKPRQMDWHLAFEAQLNAEEDRSILPVARAIREAAASAGPTAGSAASPPRRC